MRQFRSFDYLTLKRKCCNITKMEILFTTHALIRMQEREITEEQIRATILNPDNTATGRKGRKIVLKSFDGKKLKVVYKVESSNFVVITLMWIRR